MSTYHNPVICVTDRKLCPNDFLERLRRLAKAGVDGIILREKDLGEEEYRILCADVMSAISGTRTELITHTYTDGRRPLDKCEVHLPYKKFEEAQSDELLGSLYRRVLCGVSCHSVGEARYAESYGASYVIFGNVFETSCKPGKEGAGLKTLARVVKSVDITVHAIGGITPSNVEKVLEAGAYGVCLRSLFMVCDLNEIPRIVRSLKK